MSPSESTELDTLIADYLQAAERGQAPGTADLLARYPAHAAPLLDFLADLRRFGSFLGLPSPSFGDATTDFRTQGPAPAPAAVVEDSSRFGEYELIREIGRGGMGTVYQARLAGTSLMVALKQVRPAGLGLSEAARRLREEVESTAGLRHPYIVPIYHVGEHGGQPFYTMALVEGGSLEQHMNRLRGDLREAARVMALTARAIHHAHQRRILHRDLKPGNILLDEAGEPHVVDFGLATRLDESGLAEGDGALAGSLPWMAPELVRGDRSVSTAVDIWALGVILYELLTGVRPFHGSDWRQLRKAILENDPPPPRAVNPRVPRDLDAVCCQCLHKDPDRRYESASAVALDLERWLRDEPVRIRRTSSGERLLRWCRRQPELTIGAVLLLAFLVAAVTATLSFTRDQDARLRAAVCRSNEFAARHVASTVLERLEQLSKPVREAATSADLERACGKEDPEAARTILARYFRVNPGQRSPYVSVYLLNPGGKLVTLLNAQGALPAEGVAGSVVGFDFSRRDYFQGAIRHADESEGVDRIHLSRVFRSQNDGLDKLAISCCVRPTGTGTRPWVLAATITTDATLGLDSLNDQAHKAVLLAPRDTDSPRSGEPSLPPGYVILVHPLFTAGERSVSLPAGRPGPVPLPAGKPELRSLAGPPVFPSDDNYQDPVAEHGHPQYAGRWLTGSARVGNTELVVLVQQRYDEAVAPYRELLRRLLAWIAAALVIGAGFAAGLRWLRSQRRSTNDQATV